VAELDLNIQAKLLRVLETREVWPVGAVQATTSEFRLCAATLKDLRVEAREGRFREDLYFRIGRPELRLPSLAERLEEVPWFVERALAEVSAAKAEVELVEACLLRPWPGNIRELLAELRSAAIAAGDAPTVRLAHLPARAGLDLRDAPRAAATVDPPPAHPIEAALREAGGNVSQAATALGLSRGKVRRYVEKAGLDLDALRRG
ncbi:MAG: sigma 54-interacting transcriptional regulator, partial [Myxococcales bacterium]|nr:sigma 54-interacting transcriptional regulator [Myxococcales bacterium]